MAQADRDENGFYTGPGEKTITLRTPVKRDGQQPLTEITLQEPTAKQLSQYLSKVNETSDDGVEAMTLLISLCSGVVPPVLDQLKQRDHDACAAFLALFTKALPPTS